MFAPPRLMRTLPILPPGYVAQPAWCVEEEDVVYEMSRVYDPLGRLDEPRSYWAVIPDDDRDELRVISYADHRRIHGDDALDFRGFVALEGIAARMRAWLGRPDEAQARGIPLHHVEPGEAWELPPGPIEPDAVGDYTVPPEP